ncbi:hypothetical protein LEP1GSC125_0224 [Leptospira mayottensis 200901122]|uniref:Uncharacterized protein n=1 Tax=Leptospira mayottensis 200901122 TaxID=1193010 RepID=A0AA87SWA0_9LEPT|nr:hypothetical protein LEP1GSC125_0224 [Leptospira mayottensis 200901122]
MTENEFKNLSDFIFSPGLSLIFWKVSNLHNFFLLIFTQQILRLKSLKKTVYSSTGFYE